MHTSQSALLEWICVYLLSKKKNSCTPKEFSKGDMTPVGTTLDNPDVW